MKSGANGKRRRRRPSRYTVGDVAERTALTPRTIRSYQTQGLLPPPERHGRVAYYDDSHLERLEEIGELKEDGLSLATIQDVLARRETENRAKATRAKARAKADAPSRPPASTTAERGVATSAPKAASGAAESVVDVGAGTTRVPVLGIDPDAKRSDEAESPRRRLGVVAAVVLVLLLSVAAVSSVVAVMSLSAADDDRKRLGRQVSDLQSDLSRLDGNQGPPLTVVVPGPVQQPPAPGAPPTTAPPSTRTVVVTTPRQAPAAPPPAPPATTPASPPTTRPCTLNLLGACVP